MFKKTSILAALVIAFALAATSAQPVTAQTAGNLKCKGCVRSKEVKNNGIKSKDIKNGQVKNADLASDSVTSAKIAAGGVTNSDLANDAVDGAKVQNGSVTALDLGDEAGVEFIGGAQTFSLPLNLLVAVRSVTLTAPRSGFVIANASGEFSFAANAIVECLLSTEFVLDPGSRMFASSFGQAQNQIFGMTKGFAVGAGTTTVHLLCREDVEGVTIFNSDLTAIYVPTRY